MIKTSFTFTLILFFFIQQTGLSQNNCLDFDGLNDFVDCGNDSSFQVPHGTIEGWFKTQTSKVQYIAGIPYDDGSIWDPPYVGIHVGTSQGTCRFWLNVNGINEEFSGGTITYNQWNHIALTYDDSIAIGYLNGEQVADKIAIGHILYSGSPSFQIGTRSFQAQGEFFNGEIDEVRFWNVVRTETEIQNAMNQTLNGDEPGLIAYYRFNQGIAGGNNATETTLIDISPNGLNGTLNNFTLNGNSSNWVASNAPLPVGLVDFKAKLNARKIILQWWTASETNNAGFEIEKSSDGTIWQSIDFVHGCGTTHEFNAYHYDDLNPFSGINYYRLRQIDFDGAFEYSRVVAVEYDYSEKRILVFPNPSDGVVQIQIDNPTNQRINIHITDHVGRMIWERNLIEGTTNWNKEIGIQGNGIYTIVARVGDDISYERFVINK